MSSKADERLSRARILIIDDDPIVIRMLERLLRQEGFVSVEALTDPTRFMASYEAEPPDLVMVDLMMPGLSGFDVLALVERAKTDRPQPPVVVITSDKSNQARERALAGGAMDFVTKPFDRLDVLLRVRNLLARRFLELDLWSHNRQLESRIEERTHELQESLDRLRETSRQRRELALRLVTAQEEERRRIAVEVHDGSVQTIAALGIRLELLARRLTNSDESDEMERLRVLTSEALAQLRSLMSELRMPNLDPEGLAAAIRQHLAQTQDPEGPKVGFEATTERELPAESRVVLFRIAQEALTNVRKHAAASNVGVTLAEEGEGVKLTVRDDGRGFDPAQASAPGHLGLTAMKERATIAGGWCQIESAPGAGTTVSAWVPFATDEPDTAG